MLVVVIDFEHDRRAVKVEAAEIVLAMRVVGRAKIVKDGDGLHKPLIPRPRCQVS